VTSQLNCSTYNTRLCLSELNHRLQPGQPAPLPTDPYLPRGSFRLKGHPLDRVAREPHTCIWEITRRCNLRCIHCENQCGEPSTRELSSERLRAVARDLVRLGCQHIDITGGEPLLRPDWDELCRDFTGLGLRIALITNGTLLDQEHLDRALDAGVRAIRHLARWTASHPRQHSAKARRGTIALARDRGSDRAHAPAHRDHRDDRCQSAQSSRAASLTRLPSRLGRAPLADPIGHPHGSGRLRSQNPSSLRPRIWKP
jgi:organic radical activating enzyme